MKVFKKVLALLYGLVWMYCLIVYMFNTYIKSPVFKLKVISIGSEALAVLTTVYMILLLSVYVQEQRERQLRLHSKRGGRYDKKCSRYNRVGKNQQSYGT